MARVGTAVPIQIMNMVPPLAVPNPERAGDSPLPLERR